MIGISIRYDVHFFFENDTFSHWLKIRPSETQQNVLRMLFRHKSKLFPPSPILPRRYIMCSHQFLPPSVWWFLDSDELCYKQAPCSSIMNSHRKKRLSSVLFRTSTSQNSYVMPGACVETSEGGGQDWSAVLKARALVKQWNEQYRRDCWLYKHA